MTDSRSVVQMWLTSICCPFSRVAPGTVTSTTPPKKMQPLGDVITENGLVRYHHLLQSDSVLYDNIEYVRRYEGLGDIKDRRPQDLAFYCNAYNLWSMLLAYEKLQRSQKRWKGDSSF